MIKKRLFPCIDNRKLSVKESMHRAKTVKLSNTKGYPYSNNQNLPLKEIEHKAKSVNYH